MKIAEIATSLAATLLVLSGCATAEPEVPDESDYFTAISNECTERFLKWAKGATGLSEDTVNEESKALMNELVSNAYNPYREPQCMLGSSDSAAAQTMAVWIEGYENSLRQFQTDLKLQAKSEGYEVLINDSRNGIITVNLGKYDDMTLKSQVLLTFYPAEADRVKEISYEGPYAVLIAQTIVH